MGNRLLSGRKSLLIISVASLSLLLAATLFLALFRPGFFAVRDDQGSMHTVKAAFETTPVPQGVQDDAADDPAIWLHPGYPDSSRIIGTDKQGGLAVYDLTGNQLFYYPDGAMNNADLRYRMTLKDDTIDILAVSNRTSNTISLYSIGRDGSLRIVHKRQLTSEMADEVYGLCMYKSHTSNKYFVFINNKFGVVEQWELFPDGNQVDGRIVRKLKLESQVEGMVADDENAALYVGEEDKGIWKFNAEPDAPVEATFILKSGESENPNIKYDIEGLAIYCLRDGRGYLIASSQGNNSYAVFRREVPNEYLGSFRIVDGNTDGVEITDGLDVTSQAVGNTFRHGLLVVQDGSNKNEGASFPQNFKLVNWDSVAVKFIPSLDYN